MTADARPTPLLTDVLCWRMCWKGQVEGRTHPMFTVHSVEPEPRWPVGRKGLMMARAWDMLRTPATEGVFITDGDVIIDPADWLAMTAAVGAERQAVHVAPVRLWPKATSLPDWVWGHRRELPPGLSGKEVMARWQADVDDPVMFSFNFTWLPARLMEGAIKAGMAEWIYPHVDKGMWRTAKELGIPVRVVRGGCHPRHVNY